MNTATGAIQHFNDTDEIPKGFVKVNRPLTEREIRKEQINKYAPCGCGSGRKFKFCCFKPA